MRSEVLAREEPAIYKALLHPRWTVPLCQVAEFNPRRHAMPPNDADLVTFVPMRAVTEESGYIDGDLVRPWVEVKKGYTAFQNGDVIFAKITPCMENGKFALATTLHNGRAAGSTEFHVLRPKPGLLPKYLLHFVFTPNVRRGAKMNMKGAAGQLRVPIQFFETLQIPLPALEEQQRVVDHLDEQLSRLDASVAALNRVRANLKRYRASVLKAACEGRLVPTEAELARKEGRDFETGAQLLQRILAERGERSTSKRRWKQPSDLVPADGRTPPQGWSWAMGEALFDWSSGVNLVEKEFVAGDVPVFGGNGVSGFHSTHNIEHDTLVVGRVGAQCGNVHLSRGFAWITDNAIYSQSIPSSLSLPFAAIALGGKNLNRKAAGSGQPFVNQKMLNSARLPLPPLAEQHRIVAEADRRLSLLRAAEAQVASNLSRAQRLRQSILQEAFSERPPADMVA